MFLFYLEIVNKMRQVSITISEFTHSIKQPCGRCNIKFMWQFTALSFKMLLNLYWKMQKTVVQACNLLKSLSKKPWGSSKELLSILLFLFAWWGRWKSNLSVSQFFSLLFENFDCGKEVYHFIDLIRRTSELTQIQCLSFACLSWGNNVKGVSEPYTYNIYSQDFEHLHVQSLWRQHYYYEIEQVASSI